VPHGVNQGMGRAGSAEALPIHQRDHQDGRQHGRRGQHKAYLDQVKR
jgi:hypothetical protein